MSAEQLKDELQRRPELQRRLVLHRGWHRLEQESTQGRPLENTRKAFQDATFMGTAYAECDVWVTQDGEMVLSHDFCLRAMAKYPEADMAKKPICDMPWDVVMQVPLADDSTPVLLETVLHDLLPTSTRLVIEMKTSLCAQPLGDFLTRSCELVEAVGFLLSFSLETLEIVHAAMSNTAICLPLVWLVDNPRVPYDPEDYCEGETTFDPCAESLSTFLDRNGLSERVRKLGCGLSVQYNPSLTVASLQALRQQMTNLCSEGSLLHLWSDRDLDPEADCVMHLTELLPVLDCANSDLPDGFFVEDHLAGGWQEGEGAQAVPCH